MPSPTGSWRYAQTTGPDPGSGIDTRRASVTGFTIPVACTAVVWNGHVVPPNGTRELGQSERGRAHDLLWMLWNATRRSEGGDRLMFEVIFLQSGGRRETGTFKAMCGRQPRYLFRDSDAGFSCLSSWYWACRRRFFVGWTFSG